MRKADFKGEAHFVWEKKTMRVYGASCPTNHCPLFQKKKAH